MENDPEIKNLGIQEVYQLQGGIDKYFKEFPDGGFWKGKNYVSSVDSSGNRGLDSCSPTSCCFFVRCLISDLHTNLPPSKGKRSAAR